MAILEGLPSARGFDGSSHCSRASLAHRRQTAVAAASTVGVYAPADDGVRFIAVLEICFEVWWSCPYARQSVHAFCSRS